MGRTLLACAALAALLTSMSACKCPPVGGSTSGTGGTGGTVCLPAPCVRTSDCSACYRSEADRDMGKLADCLPHDGACDCKWDTRTCEERMPGTHCGPQAH